MDRSPLAKLAPELRNRIYEIVLKSEKPLKISLPVRGHKRSTRNSSRKLPTLLSLVATCREVRDEALQMLYASNEFEIQTDHHAHLHQATTFEKFVEQIGTTNAKALRSVRLSQFEMATMSGRRRFEETLKSLMRVRAVAKLVPRCDVKVQCRLGEISSGRYSNPTGLVQLDLQDLGLPWEELGKAVLDGRAGRLYGTRLTGKAWVKEIRKKLAEV